MKTPNIQELLDEFNQRAKVCEDMATEQDRCFTSAGLKLGSNADDLLLDEIERYQVEAARLRQKASTYRHGAELVERWSKLCGLLPKEPSWFVQARSTWPTQLDPQTVPDHVYDAWLDWRQKDR